MGSSAVMVVTLVGCPRNVAFTMVDNPSAGGLEAMALPP
jgi:hypothetical protein